MFEAVTPGSLDYSNLIEKLQAADIEALYYGGYPARRACSFGSCVIGATIFSS